MRSLGWRGPKAMRWGEKAQHGYWRFPTIGPPAVVHEEPAAEIATIGVDGSLAPELERGDAVGIAKAGAGRQHYGLRQHRARRLKGMLIGVAHQPDHSVR